MAGDRGAREASVADRIHRLEFALEWPPWTVAAYLIDGSEPILVDAGVPGDDGRDELLEGLAAVDREPADVEHLLLTHPHSDHIGQVTTVMEEGEPTVYVPRRVRDRLRRSVDDLEGSVRETASGAGLGGDRLESAVQQAVDSLERDRRLLPPEEIDVALSYGDPFTVAGHRFEAIHTPGHQADHACFELRRDGGDLLFSGDMVIEPFRAAALNVGFDRGVYDSVRQFYGAYDRLAGRDVARVYPGHGPVFDGFAGAVERSRHDLDEMVEDVRETVGAIAPATPRDVALARAGDEERLTHVLLDTAGALGYLDRVGRVTYDVATGVRRYRPA